MPRPPGHGPNFQIRKNQIIDLAAQLFADRGYAATNLDDLGVAANLGKGALYYYIGSKEKLLAEIQSRVVHPAQDIATAINELDLDPVVRLRILSEALLVLMYQRLPHIWAYEQDFRHLTGENAERSRRERKLFEQTLSSLIEEAISTGIFRPMEPRLAMLQFLNLHNYTYRWLDPKRDWTSHRLSAEYCRTLLAGFLSAEGSYDLEGLEARVASLPEAGMPDVLRPILWGQSQRDEQASSY